MVLVHSRIRRVFYAVESRNGALGSVCALHQLSRLNHHFNVFRFVPAPAPQQPVGAQTRPPSQAIAALPQQQGRQEQPQPPSGSPQPPPRTRLKTDPAAAAASAGE
jgi:hypothetical protein